MEITFKIGKEEIVLTENKGGSGFQLGKNTLVKDPDTGEKVKKNIGFNWFYNLPNAFNKLLELKIRASDARTLNELRGEIMKAKDELLDCYGGMEL